MMDPAERRTVETLKSSFKHIATTLDATCIATRPHPPSHSHDTATAPSASTSQSQPDAPNTSLARILADHHRIRGSALRCLMTALDIDRLAIDKAHRHIALLHEAGQHREAGQAERAVRGYPPLLEVLHVVLEKNGVEEWDRWTRRQENAERDEALARYVPFPFTAAATSPNAQPLPTPIAHLLPTLAERQQYDDPPPSSPPRSPPRTAPPPDSAQPTSRPPSARVQMGGQRQAASAAADGSRSAGDEVRLKRAIEADDRARAKRLAAKKEKERQQRLEAKKRAAIRAAEEGNLLDGDNEVQEEVQQEDKEEASEIKDRVQQAAGDDKNSSKEQAIVLDDETDAEVEQLASIQDDTVADGMQLDGNSPSNDNDGAADGMRLESSSPSDGALPVRPQLLAGVSNSPTAADVSPVNGVENGVSGSVSPYSVPSSQHSNGSPLNSYSAMDGDLAAVPHSFSTSTSSSPSFPSYLDSRHTATNTNNTALTSSHTATRPARTRKKAPRYGEDDLYTPNERPPKPHRPSPRKADTQQPPTSPAPPASDTGGLWEIDDILCFRFRAYPPFHELAGSAYRSFLVRWKEYPRATWVMEEELVSVDRRQMERLAEWDDWRLMPASAEVEVEEEEPWLGGGEDGAGGKEQKKRRRGPRLGSANKKKRS